MSSWNNTALQQCLCWDSKERTWCDDQTCKEFWQGATPELIGGVSVVALLFLVMLGWVIVSAVRCVTLQRYEGTESKRVVSGYKIVSTVVFVILIAACCIATQEARTDGYKSVSSLADVVILKVNDDTSRVGDMQTALDHIRQLPGNYINYDVSKEFEDLASSVQSYSSNIIDGKSDILSAFTPLAEFTVWIPALLCLVSFILIMCNVHKCCSFVNVWFIACTIVMFCSIQFMVGILSFTSASACRDYDGVASTTTEIWSSTFGYTYGNEHGIKQLTNNIRDSFRNDLCARDMVGWEEYFSHGECGGFDSLQKLLSGDSSLKSSHDSDRGECSGDCPIAECAQKCVAGSNSQQKSSDIMNAYNTIATNTNNINTALIPLVTGQSFPQFLAMLQDPLCNDFKPSSTRGNAELTTIAVHLLLMLILSMFIPVIFYRLPVSEYQIITNVEDEGVEFPEKPKMFAPSAPVLK